MKQYTKQCKACKSKFAKSKNCSLKEWKTKRKFCSFKCYWKYSIGYKRPQTVKNCISQTMKTKGISPIKKWIKGINSPYITFGEDHWNWKGGISVNPYPKEFNKKLKLKIRQRDNFQCILCGKTEREELEELNRVLSVNHIDFDKNNCKENNLNTLCQRCNIKINREREYWTNYFQT